MGKRSEKPGRPQTPGGTCAGPVDRLHFPDSIAPCCPPPPTWAASFSAHPISQRPGAAGALPRETSAQAPVHSRCGHAPSAPGGSAPADFPLPRASQACPVRAPLGPASSAPGGWALSPQTSHRPARPGHAQCGRSGLGPGSALAAAGGRARRSRATAVGEGPGWAGARRRSCQVGAGSAEPGPWGAAGPWA